jgi:hypothetical protein
MKVTRYEYDENVTNFHLGVISCQTELYRGAHRRGCEGETKRKADQE